MKNNKVLVFLYRESVGELNVALPIINKLKLFNNYEKVYFYVTSKEKYRKIDSLYKDIMSNQGEIFIGKIKLLNLINKNLLNNVTFVTTDKSPTIEYNLINKYLNTTTILMHHSQTIFYKEGLESEYTQKKKHTINEIYHPDFFLVGNSIDSNNNYYSSFNYDVPKEKVKYIGALSYEKKWLDLLINKDKSDINFLLEKKKNFKKTILVTTRGPHKDCMEEKDYLYQVNSILKIAEEFKNYLFIIKPHPREKLKIYKNAFSKSTNNIFISNHNAYKLCSISDLVISFWSSVIQDCAITGKPVIEFHKHTIKNSKMLIRTKNGLESYFKYYGFSFYVDNYEDLLTILQKEIDLSLLNKHLENINHIFSIDENKINDTLDTIRNFMLKKQVYKKNKKTDLYIDFLKYSFFKKKKVKI